MLETQLKLINKLGLHARASAKLVALAERFESEVYLIREDNGLVASSKSIMGLMMLAATFGTPLTLKAEGPDAKEAMDAVVNLINQKFGEDA